MIDEQLKKTAATLVEYCNSRNEMKALDELYADNAVSVEAVASPDGSMPQAIEGLQGIRGKHEWWFGAHEVHSSTAEGPFYHGPDKFGVVFDIDITDKASGNRTQMRDLGVYTVVDGKIVREEFYYDV